MPVPGVVLAGDELSDDAGDELADALGGELDDEPDEELSGALVFCDVPPRSPGCAIASTTPMTMSRSAATPTAPVILEFRGFSLSWVLERATGIEPASSDWKPEALPLSYARKPAGEGSGGAAVATMIPHAARSNADPGQLAGVVGCYHP